MPRDVTVSTLEPFLELGTKSAMASSIAVGSRSFDAAMGEDTWNGLPPFARLVTFSRSEEMREPMLLKV